MSYSFKLNFSQDKNASTVLFPIPQSNHYQKISALILPSATDIITISKTTSVGIFKSTSENMLQFKQTPTAINCNITTAHIAQKESSRHFISDEFINKNDKKMKLMAEKWLLETKAKTALEILFSLYTKTLDFLAYGNPIRDLYTYSDALENKKTDCGGFSTFLATLLQTQNIPCRLVVGYLFRNDLINEIARKLHLTQTFKSITMHAWLEVEKEDGSWFPVDPSVEWKKQHGMSTRAGGFGYIPADRLVVSTGHNHSVMHLEKKYLFPILQHQEVLE